MRLQVHASVGEPERVLNSNLRWRPATPKKEMLENPPRVSSATNPAVRTIGLTKAALPRLQGIPGTRRQAKRRLLMGCPQKGLHRTRGNPLKKLRKSARISRVARTGTSLRKKKKPVMM